MNITLIKDKWIKFYKRGFMTGLMVLSFICFIDQILQSPFFFKLTSNGVLFINYIHIYYEGSFNWWFRIYR